MLALSWRPALLILDEPTIGLDAIARQQVFAQLLSAVQGEDRAVLISMLLRIQGSPAALWVPGASGVLMPPLVKVGLGDGLPGQIVFPILGAIALCTAAFVNHRTLTRSTSSSLSYRRPAPPSGIPATHKIR